MRLTTCCLLAALPFLAPAFVNAQKKGTNPAGQTGWRNNLDQARQEAKLTGKPIFLVFRCQP